MVLHWVRHVNLDSFPVSGVSIIFLLAVPSSGFLSSQAGSRPFPQITDTTRNRIGAALSCRRLRRNPRMRLPWQEAVPALYCLHCIVNAMRELHFLSSFV